MGMHVHELHAAAVHAPLVLLPAAAAVDLAAALNRKASTASLGRRLWWLTVGGAAVAGVAGLAAAHEIKAADPETEDMLWLHGIGNFGILLGGIGIALWRRYRKPSLAEASIGIGATALAAYTAYLGGEMVYARGVGVRAVPPSATAGVGDSPPVLSAAAPRAFFRDAAAGLGWLVRRTVRALLGRQPVHPHALLGGGSG